MRKKKIKKIQNDISVIKSHLSNYSYDIEIINLINKSDVLLEKAKKLQSKINNEDKVLVSFKKFIKSLFVRKEVKKYVLYNNTNHTKLILQ